jgi:hypothetical protein
MKLFYSICFKYDADKKLKLKDLQDYVTEIIRLPKQARDDPLLVRHIESIRSEIAKFSKNGFVELPDFLRLMKGNVIAPQDQEYFLTDEELYTMTLKRFFKYASGASDKVATKDEMKYWLVNQMKIEMTEQDFELFWTHTLGGEDVTEEVFIDLCRNGRHANDDEIAKEERKLAEMQLSEIHNKDKVFRHIIKPNPGHYIKDQKQESETSFVTEIGHNKLNAIVGKH